MDAILEEWAPLIVLVTDSVEERVAKVEKKRYKFSEADRESAVDVPSEIFIVANLLRFLKILLKTGKDKRCFLSYAIVGKLLRAVDSSIADLASWVLFNATTPTFSVDTFNTMELELKEVVEVPSCVSEDALILFEGLECFLMTIASWIMYVVMNHRRWSPRNVISLSRFHSMGRRMGSKNRWSFVYGCFY